MSPKAPECGAAMHTFIEGGCQRWRCGRPKGHPPDFHLDRARGYLGDERIHEMRWPVVPRLVAEPTEAVA